MALIPVNFDVGFGLCVEVGFMFFSLEHFQSTLTQIPHLLRISIPDSIIHLESIYSKTLLIRLHLILITEINLIYFHQLYFSYIFVIFIFILGLIFASLI
jgi:hypothetical protein